MTRDSLEFKIANGTKRTRHGTAKDNYKLNTSDL